MGVLFFLPIFLIVLGVIELLSEKTFLGWIFGQQLVIQSIATLSLLFGITVKKESEGQAFSFVFILLGAVLVLSTLALATRRFYMSRVTTLLDRENKGEGDIDG